MSSSGAKALSRDQWMDVMGHIREVTSGKKPWEHPGSPPFRMGEAYTPNTEEDQFMKNTARKMQASALRGMVMWMVAPYVMFHIPAFRSSLFKNTKSPVWICVGMGSMGYIGGTLRNADAIAEERFRLENSPLAKEGRWKIRKLNPKHPWLAGFEDEFREGPIRHERALPPNQFQGFKSQQQPPQNNISPQTDNYQKFDDGFSDPQQHQRNREYNLEQLDQMRGKREYNDNFGQQKTYNNRAPDPYQERQPQYYNDRRESPRDSHRRGQRQHSWDDNHKDGNYNYGGYKQNSTKDSDFVSEIDERHLETDFVVDPSQEDEWVDTPSRGYRR